MINLEAIRQRDAEYNDSFEANEKFGLRLAYPVEDRRALLAHVDRLTMANLDGVEHAETLRRAYDALAAERDALRKDAERYRWLRDSAGNDIMEKLMTECSPPRWDELVDAAIDAAMGERP